VKPRRPRADEMNPEEAEGQRRGAADIEGNDQSQRRGMGAKGCNRNPMVKGLVLKPNNERYSKGEGVHKMESESTGD
jgi:hypothetical protein